MGTRRSGTMILWRIYVPQELAVQIELQLADPLRDKPEYGARSQLVTYLLQEHLNRVHAEHQSRNLAKEPAHD